MSNRYRKDGSVLHIGEKKSGRGVIGEEREKMAANREHLVGVYNKSFGVSGRQKKMGNGRQKGKRQKKIP